MPFWNPTGMSLSRFRAVSIVPSWLKRRDAFLRTKRLLSTAISDSYPEREMKAAADIAKQIGIRFETINTDELEMEGYASNPANRCYFCKTELFTKLKPIAERYRVSTIVYGAIPDDVGDYRPRHGCREKHGHQSAADRCQSDKSRHSRSIQTMGTADMGQTRFCLSVIAFSVRDAHHPRPAPTSRSRRTIFCTIWACDSFGCVIMKISRE